MRKSTNEMIHELIAKILKEFWLKGLLPGKFKTAWGWHKHTKKILKGIAENAKINVDNFPKRLVLDNNKFKKIIYIKI